MDYAQHFDPTKTPQGEKADPRQVPNSAGGYSFELDKWKRLERFLILGSDGGSYYVTERELTRDNAKVVIECLAEDGPRAVEAIAALSQSGRAPKNDSAVFALALAAADPNAATRAAALEALPRVCRIGTHLFAFTKAVDQFRGWGRGLQRGIGRWYERQSADDLAYQVVKYQQRDGMSHRDVLRLAHLDPTVANNALYRWIVAGGEGLGERQVKRKGKDAPTTYPAVGELPALVQAYQELLRCTDLARVVALIRQHRMTHEMVSGEWKSKPEVWEALSEHMPLHALVRNLAKLTQSGVIAPLSDRTKAVCERITNADQLRKARLHPIAVLAALKTYQQGHGERGKLTWSPVPQVVEALDAAFYAAFQHIEPTGRKMLLAIDVSGSMGTGTVGGMAGITPRIAAAAMAMVTARTEKHWHMIGFGSQLVDLPITPHQRLDDVVRVMEGLPFQGTDCALPMLWAIQRRADVDAFCVYTDNETWYGKVHPHQALGMYRASFKPAAKLAVVGLVSNGFTIADPADSGMLDFVGFDAAAPAVLADWLRG